MNVRTYSKRPLEVQAVQWNGLTSEMHHIIGWILESGGRASIRDGYPSQGPDSIVIEMPDGKEDDQALPGDWIVRKENGDFTTCTDEVFQQTYMEVKE